MELIKSLFSVKIFIIAVASFLEILVIMFIQSETSTVNKCSKLANVILRYAAEGVFVNCFFIYVHFRLLFSLAFSGCRQDTYQENARLLECLWFAGWIGVTDGEMHIVF